MGGEYQNIPRFFLFLHSKLFIMGRGDKRTKRGKITIGSFGKARPARTRRRATKTEKKA
jgi:30S ribosomal protein S31